MKNKHPLLLWEEVSTTRRNMEYLQKNCEDLLRNRSPKQIPHNAATKYIP